MIKERSPTASEPNLPLLRVADLALSFDLGGGRRLQAIDGLSLTLHAGRTLALVGESGSGKSVTALSILRLIPCPPGRFERGTAIYRGRDLMTLPESQMLQVRGREIAMIFQEPMTSLNPVFTIGDQIVEAIRLHQRVGRAEAREKAAQSLSDVGIDNPRRRLAAFPHQFSGGMQQRVMIAMALACQPGILLADEPTTALDVTIQAQILRLIRDLQQQRNMAILFISHNLSVVADTADVVCVMYGGRVVEYASVEDLFSGCYHPYTRGLISCIPRVGERKPRLTTIDDIITNPDQFRRLPGYRSGIIPWWPHMDPPEDVSEAPGQEYCLHEIDPGHWVGCWRTEYLRHHPERLPDI